MALWASEASRASGIKVPTIGSPTYDSLQDWFNTTQSSGVISGGEITDNGDGSVTVAAGTGLIKSNPADVLSETSFFDWEEDINVALADDGRINWVYIENVSGTINISSTIDFTALNWSTQFIIGTCYREGTSVSVQDLGSRRYNLANRLALKDYETFGYQRVDGLVLGETGTLNASMTLGHFYALYEKLELTAVDTSVSGDIRYWFRDGSGGWNTSTISTYDNVKYDDSDGVLGDLGTGRYGVIWCFVSLDGNLNFVYGRVNTPTLSIAQNEPLYSDLPDFVNTFSLLIGQVIVKQGQASVVEILSAFETVFQTAQATDHNSLANLNVGDYLHLSSVEKAEALSDFTRQNLLTNSGFGVWSNSDGPHNVGSQVTLTDVTAGVCLTTNTQDIAVGDLFKFDSGDLSGTLSSITGITADVSFTLFDTTLADSGLPGTGYEVTPGIIGANSLGPDGWYKDSTLDIYRESADVKEGSIHGVKCVPSAANDYIRWPLDTQVSVKPAHLKKFRGRTATFGAWVKTSIASHANLRLYDGDQAISPYHTGGGSYEWLEVTKTISTIADVFYVWSKFDQASGDVFICQPMLIFGDHIGEGNYAPILQEIIWFEGQSVSNLFQASVNLSDVAWATLDPEVDSNGEISPDIGAVFIAGEARDAASSSASCQFKASQNEVSTEDQFTISPQGLTNDTFLPVRGWLACNQDGNFRYKVDATGTGTWDFGDFIYLGIQLR